MTFSLIIKILANGIYVFRIDVAFLELAVRGLFWYETEHFAVSDV